MLNETQRKFVAATLRGAGPKEAAIAAGLSPDTAGPAGARMRKHPKVVAALGAVGVPTPGANPDTNKPAPSEDRAPTISLPGEEEEEPIDDLPKTTDAKEFLEAVVASPNVKLAQRMEAAKTLIPFQHGKIGEKGKKETKADSAKVASTSGRFATPAPPKLVVSNREA